MFSESEGYRTLIWLKDAFERGIAAGIVVLVFAIVAIVIFRQATRIQPATLIMEQAAPGRETRPPRRRNCVMELDQALRHMRLLATRLR